MFRDKFTEVVVVVFFQGSHVVYIYGADSQFLRAGSEGVNRNKAKMLDKDFHQYCLISKIRSYDAAGSEVQRPERTAGIWRLPLTEAGLGPRFFFDNSFEK